jgi:hypothetical protein
MNTVVFHLNDKTDLTYTEVTGMSFNGTSYIVVSTGPQPLVVPTVDNVLSYEVS